VDILERRRALGRKPKELLVDNGPEFRSRALDAWCYAYKVQLTFIQPGKPTQNAFIESFNGTFRDECLNEHWFTDPPTYTTRRRRSKPGGRVTMGRDRTRR